MSAQDKAKELVEKFKAHSYYDGHDLTSRTQREKSNKESAVECALICVDEILLAIQDDPSVPNEKWNFWQDVKKQIELL